MGGKEGGASAETAWTLSAKRGCDHMQTVTIRKRQPEGNGIFKARIAIMVLILTAVKGGVKVDHLVGGKLTT